MISATDSTLAIGMPGMPEMLMIMFIALLLFGKRLPEVARSMGRSINEFKKGLSEAQQEIQTAVKDDVHPASTTPPLDQPANQEQTPKV